MKHLILCLIMMICFSSCMGESGDVETYGSQVGVVHLVPDKVIQLRSGDRITSDDLQNQPIDEGHCCLVDFRINHSKQEHNDDRIYRVNILQYTPVPSWKLLSRIDTTSAHRNESFLDFDIDKSLYVDGHLFIYPEYRTYYRSQRDSFWISYNPNLELTTDELTGKRCFELYLRSVTWRTDYSDTTFTSKTLVPQAFDIHEFVEKAKASGFISGDSLNFRIVSPEFFADADSSSYLWRTSSIYTLELNKQPERW